MTKRGNLRLIDGDGDGEPDRDWADLIDPATLGRLERLQLSSRERLIGRFTGEHDSVRFGDTVDYADFREYHPGDDFRRIDYHVLARLDQLLIKLFEADDTITLRILLDTSASMAAREPQVADRDDWATSAGDKLTTAKQIAAMLGFVALINNDTVALHTMPSVQVAQRFSSRAALPELFAALTRLEAGGPTPFAQAAGDVVGHRGERGITIVISDLLTVDWPSLVRLRADGSSLVVMHVLSRDDTSVGFEGDVQLVDAESGVGLPVSVDDSTGSRFASGVEAYISRVRARCLAVQAAYISIDAATSPEELLFSHWRQAGVLR